NIDLNELLITHPAGTYFLRVSGTTMIDANISDGDIVIVDSSLQAHDGNIIIASIDGEFTIKKLQKTPYPALIPMNPSFSPIPIADWAEFTVFGVVTYVIHKTL
ncbi:translesion error-prone DNA polymerase V autoproteolytic subunit, partial [Providencia manganoxydans]|uniref:translesion error-prone DNA polymerase V autoproteolytic subunit n=1 Tax=Providencia manganoxydans TaxID=2923283 RepID=UPI0034E4F55B